MAPVFVTNASSSEVSKEKSTKGCATFTYSCGIPLICLHLCNFSFWYSFFTWQFHKSRLSHMWDNRFDGPEWKRQNLSNKNSAVIKLLCAAVSRDISNAFNFWKVKKTNCEKKVTNWEVEMSTIVKQEQMIEASR